MDVFTFLSYLPTHDRGRLKHFSKHPIRYKAWTTISQLNHSHALYAWISLFAVAFADIYVRQVSSGAWTNFYFF